MIWVEFLKDYGCCWREGERGQLLPRVVEILEGKGILKRIQAPEKNKMVESPQKAKNPMSTTGE